MILSIVTGTYNRLDYLRAMIDSARNQLPPGISYEFVVVDGGSKDGTLAWCKEQGDVRLIEHGNLFGAIKAFCDGARAAHGDYVLLANDDILFHDGAIIKALAYLDRTPHCGAVAFADNRKVPGYGDGYKVQFVPAVDPDGKPVSVPYAQVGLYRRALGDVAGWWGDTDPIMQQARTYGGDNYLSARIWEMGFTVEAVEGAAVVDRVPQDDLRRMNSAHDGAIQSPYHQRFPQGAHIGSAPYTGAPMDEHLRILYLPLYSPGYGRYKRGLCDALAKVGMVYELDYARQRDKFLSVVDAFQPHLILTQFHDAHTILPDALRYARTLAPAAAVVNWCGDVYQDSQTAPDMLELLQHVDLALVVNADLLPIYEAHGIRAAYWQIGFEPVPADLPAEIPHDILFMANAYSPARKELAAVLHEISGNVGLYGYGWDEFTGSGNTFYNFARGAALYHSCKIAIGDNQYGDKGFVSNRLFEALANGAFLLHQTIPGLEELTGLVDGEHYVAWRDYEDLRAKARSYLTHEKARRTIAEAGERFVRAHHSFDARVRELFALLEGTDERPETVASRDAVATWMD